jgi:hypothetical protein
MGFFYLEDPLGPVQQGYHAPGQARPDLQQIQHRPKGLPELYMPVQGPGSIEQEIQFIQFRCSVLQALLLVESSWLVQCYKNVGRINGHSHVTIFANPWT